MACKGLKMGSFHLFRHSRWSTIIFEKTHFSPIFALFCVPKQPIIKTFRDFRRAKEGHHEVSARQKHLFWHSMCSKIPFQKNLFFGTRWTHFGTHLFRLPLAACHSPLGLGTGV